MAHHNIMSTPLTMTICRAVFIKYAKSIGIMLSMFSFFVHSATENQLDQIRTAAEQHILSTLEQPAGGELSANAANIDPRIKATDCPEPLETSASSTSSTRSNINVLVECVADNWKVYVPVRISASVPMIVSTRQLGRGEIISASDVTTSMIELQRFRKDGFTNYEQVVGSKLKRNVRLGDVVERNDVCVVCRNEKVTIKAIKSGMTITTQGTALQDGSSGDQVRVKNDKSQRIIEGIVTGIAEITVTF
ncbi:flagella basal body P-ring formation protein FlgA [Vibrio alfacsensis]|uniref:Flagella basal body P-ring formation protein FlgA n=1 Tax=Vibrio alfacsensis TaxID=1074311 RepID=A0ABM6YUZ0_9VIBR|nr:MULTISPECIES: flagellar basal body P-ring formation chaperone FlgA [Vibrio]AXY01654.1 flagella basal body P-ring formation protein FlgA [Vibrio alfacsensis]CAE6953307.1 Involved in the assembly process of the P-ring formation. It may associate with FlgF on the rod constituting a structure essential for the P-ring assembly or may act as a modulator protein for the P-ring assembly [Vibrio sp. B1REV9]